MSAQCRLSLAAAAIAVGCVATSPSTAQDQPGTPQDRTIVQNPDTSTIVNAKTRGSANLLDVPLVNNIPGGVKVPMPKSPVEGDKNAVQRGMKYFVGFNCVGCHAANGGGGMGPSLSNSFFKFGADPAQMYNVIAHGGPQGMPAWGSVLPDSVIWDITAYIQSISQAPSSQWGTTTNLAERLPSIEQVPAEFMNTAEPWKHTQPFSSGQKPTSHKPTSSGVSAQGAKAE